MNKVGGSDPKNTLYCSFCGWQQSLQNLARLVEPEIKQ